MRTRMICLLFVAALFTSACATVRPQERAIQADPTMVYGGEPHEDATNQHAVENREGSMGGTGVSGGGCGCN
jgi:uncharacterized protein YceK